MAVAARHRGHVLRVGRFRDDARAATNRNGSIGSAVARGAAQSHRECIVASGRTGGHRAQLAEVHRDRSGNAGHKQRECNGPEDCERANIEVEQTEASRAFNRLSRTSQRKAIELLGSPDFVLRAGDVVPVEHYRNNPTERSYAEAIIMWRNGHCAANEVHVLSRGGQVNAGVMTGGGTECTIDSKPFPMPTDAFSCAKGRKADPLCKLEGVLRLPGL